jgi:acetyltransferase-like isoleucine patch superfamily enzyme
MKAKSVLSRFPGIIFSPSLYIFLLKKIRASYQRQMLLERLRTRFPGVKMHDDLLVTNPDHIAIGAKTTIGQRCLLQSGYPPEEGSIRIGSNVIIGYNTCLYAGGGHIVIADNVDIGLHTVLTAQSRNLSQNPVQEHDSHEHVLGEIFIGEGTLVASHVTILPGTSLGKFCNIVAGSVVQGKYPDHTTLAGNPAKPFPRIDFNKA